MTFLSTQDELTFFVIKEMQLFAGEQGTTEEIKVLFMYAVIATSDQAVTVIRCPWMVILPVKVLQVFCLFVLFLSDCVPCTAVAALELIVQDTPLSWSDVSRTS